MDTFWALASINEDFDRYLRKEGLRTPFSKPELGDTSENPEIMKTAKLLIMKWNIIIYIYIYIYKNIIIHTRIL